MVLLAPTQTTPPLPPTLVWVPLPSIPTPLLLPPLLSLFQIRPPLYFCCFMTWPPSHQPMRERAFSVAFPRKVPPILEVWDPTHDNRRHNHTSPRPYHRLCTPLYLTPASVTSSTSSILLWTFQVTVSVFIVYKLLGITDETPPLGYSTLVGCQSGDPINLILVQWILISLIVVV